ncbi:unnamed protein product [Rotaria magnacalcarata]|uniref:Uncharacterized protein n=1 Tax=Rotaria magnacalcarata TaxID=392030 RepID=A0A816T7Q9_9BILA|nr:unnamed protein product [Rotaria magnacalcarata]CAF1680100.1 unnamed protein product [Rotaria magnacalcarata]CAF2059963.1 unnamed protein product [Rotaria magnacalcarata]CAF2091954.1 unnamed protein product [Rotaria magnacalcarata]CAF2105736.1 unnamed protein product [Rotaria magnacalcarata]
MASYNSSYDERYPSLAALAVEKRILEEQLVEEQRALQIAIAEKERREKLVEQTKIDLLALEKVMRQTRSGRKIKKIISS